MADSVNKILYIAAHILFLPPTSTNFLGLLHGSQEWQRKH